MLFRKTYLESRSVLANSGEKTTDIRVRDPITAIWLEVRATNSTTNNQDNTMAQNISAIEVLDGSDVIYSLDGEEALALTAYYLGHIPNQLISEQPSVSQSLSILIPFGRWIGDPVYAFDPTRFTNPQVRVTWNLAAVNAVGVTGFGTGTGRLTILPVIMQDGARPRGLLTIKEQYTSTGAASGDDFVELPRDLRYLAILLRAYKTVTAVYNVLDDVKLSIDQDRIVPFNMRMSDLLRFNALEQDRFHYRHGFHKADADTIKTILKHGEMVSPVSYNVDDNVFRYNSLYYGEGVINIDSAGSAQTSDCYFFADVHGYAPYGCVWIPFGELKEPGDWLPVPQYKSFRAILTQEVASATIAICTVQERLYA